MKRLCGGGRNAADAREQRQQQEAQERERLVLEGKIDAAVKDEQYELAAKLKQELVQLKGVEKQIDLRGTGVHGEKVMKIESLLDKKEVLHSRVCLKYVVILSCGKTTHVKGKGKGKNGKGKGKGEGKGKGGEGKGFGKGDENNVRVSNGANSRNAHQHINSGAEVVWVVGGRSWGRDPRR